MNIPKFIPKFRCIKGTIYIDKETYNRDVMKVKEYKEDEIDRLNNIINELEKWLEDKLFNKTNFNVDEAIENLAYSKVLDKLKELKENK